MEKKQFPHGTSNSNIGGWQSSPSLYHKLIEHSTRETDSGLSLDSLPELIEKLEFKMKETAKDLDFEKAAILRDRIKKLRHRLIGK